MHFRQIAGWLLCPVLALPAGAQLMGTGSAASPAAVPSLDQLLPPAAPNPFSGSVPAATPQPGVLDLTVQDALDRGLRYNLGIILSSQNTVAARAARLHELSNLLPHLNGDLRESYTKVNLQAQGLTFKIPGVNIGRAVEFSDSDARVSLSEDLIDLHALNNLRAATASVRAQGFTFDSARETVVLAVAASYLLVLSAESRADAVSAEVRTAQALQKLAEDRESAGLSPEIDTLRARVELEVRRQNLIEANDNLAKQRITLARVLGLPVRQQFRLTTRIPHKPLPPVDQASLLSEALAQRPDYLAAEQQVKAAELRLKAARSERLPSLGLNGDYGVIGTRPGNAFPTWTINAGVKIPIFEGGKIDSDIRQAEAAVAQRKAERDDLRGRIDQDIADALLDVSASADQLKVARITREYARKALTQAQDRFAAGVTNNIEVIQAQESLANADQQYIASLYSHDIAKVLLARAVGTAETSVRQALAAESATDHSGANQAPPAAPPAPPGSPETAK